MTGILEAVGAGGAAAGGEAGAAGSTGAAGAASAGSTLTGLGGMGPEASTTAMPAFSSGALPTNQAMALQRAGEMGNPAFAAEMSPDASMGMATRPAETMNMSSPKGGGGGYGEAMKSLTSGKSGEAAMDLMKIAASRAGGNSGGTIPSLPARQGGGGTQPSVQQFLQALGQRRQAGLRMGG